MRLLIINFAMDDSAPVLAWQAGVARELARRCEFVAVFTERLGACEVAPNMHVEELARPVAGAAWKLAGGPLANRQIAGLCRRFGVQACFIHMAMQWGYRAWPALRALRVPTLLWYAHGSVAWDLRLAHRCVTRVVTSTPEGFRIPSRKVRVIGQGVDTDLFRLPERAAQRDTIVYVGRVSPRKRVDLLVETMACLRERAPGLPLRLRVVGPMLSEADLAYDAALRADVWRRGLQDRVTFEGFVPQEHTPALYRDAFLHLSVSETGSMDKTVLEALACGCPVLTSNPAFRELLAGYPAFTAREARPEALAEQVLRLYERRDAYDPAALRSLVVGRHDRHSYVARVMGQIEEIAGRGGAQR